MIKTLIYPFSSEMSPLLNQGDFFLDMEITSIVSLKGNGILGDKYKFQGKDLRVSEDFDSNLRKCSHILLNNFYSEDIEDIVLENIKKAVNNNKKIIFFNSNKNLNKLYEIIPEKQQVEIKNKNLAEIVQESQGRLYNIDTPVVFVCSIFEELDKFEIQLSLRKKLLKDGYKVIQIGTRQTCELFNFYSFPEFMYSKEMEEHDKIVLFNNVLKKLEVTEKPDIIVIGVPGGILPFSSKAFGDLGLTMYKILQAVTPDCTILSLPYSKYHNEDISYFGELIKRKFNIDIDYYNIAAKSVLAQPTESTGRAKYLTLEDSLVKIKIDDLYDNNVFCLSDESEMDKLVELMIKEFIKYGTVASI